MADKDLVDDDYVLIEGAAWFTVKKFSVRIRSTEEGVAVEVYELGKEDGWCLGSSTAFDRQLPAETGSDDLD